MIRTSLPSKREPAPLAASPEETVPWGWLEVFVVVQFLSPALLFLPGAQSMRFAIRALPFITSLVFWVVIAMRPVKKAGLARGERGRRGMGRHPSRPSEGGAGKWLMFALLTYPLGFAHPDSVFAPAVAQWIFQLAIAGPCFWAWRLVRGPAMIERFVWLVLACNAASAGVGALQVYWPDHFMPPEFSRVGLAMNQYWVEALSYIGSSGQRIVRPPGLSDQPGGAAGAAMIIGTLGIVLASRADYGWLKRFFCIGAAGLGMFVLYLCQVRSLFLVMLIGVLVAGLILLRSGHFQRVAAMAGLAGILVTTTFGWAVAVGGKSVADRFLGIKEEGVVESFQRNRGLFLEYTLEEILLDYPLGAGVGRWGMMNIYFKSVGDREVEPIHVEIQMTGWILDGGWALLLCYVTAIGLAMRQIFRTAMAAPSAPLAYAATVAFSFNLAVIAQSFAGPTFNTQAGIMFWLIYSVVTRAFELSGPAEPHLPLPAEPSPSRPAKRFLTQ